MSQTSLAVRYLVILVAFCLSVACFKPMDLEKDPVPKQSLVLEFAIPLKYVMDLTIDGKEVPIRYARRNRLLWIEGLSPGTHTVNIHSISYVFGPEFESFKVEGETGNHFFVQARRYRSNIPKDRSRVSIRAYRKRLKERGIDVNQSTDSGIRAYFTRGK